ncbi:MAG: AAA family ATPase [Thermodesulfobacteriota bacterium]
MELPRVIEALTRPGAYPERPEKVGFEQTHISYLFFTPEFVYKVKKHVDFGFLDFTTLQKRRHFCEEEVRLNSRLAPGVYLGVVEVIETEDGIFMETDHEGGEEGEGRTVEYAVKMKRLPEDGMLDTLLVRDRVDASLMKKAAGAIASFHRTAETSEHIAHFGEPGTIERNTEENFFQVSDYIGRTITQKQFDDIKAYTKGFLSSHKGLFIERVKDGFIRDCHGDIHSEHVSVADGISIFDCIEFNERFRYSDTVADMAFLAMDLDYHGRGDLSRTFEDAYFSLTGDEEGREFLDFYKCYRAFLRGKVEGFKLAEPEESEEDKRAAAELARLHFHLAHLYATGGYRPVVLAVCGLSGTGKSALARSLGHRAGITVLSSDAVRKELHGVAPDEHRFERYGEGIYSGEATERTYEELMERAGAMAASGRSVILDATFSRGEFLDAAKRAASDAGALFRVVECTADEEAVRERFEKRGAAEGEKGGKGGGGAVSDARWEIYLRQKESFEPVALPHLTITSDAPPDELAGRVIRRLF